MTSSGRSARALVGGRGSGPRSREHVSSRSIAEHRGTSPSVVISPHGQHRLGRGTGVVAEEAGIQQQVVQLSSLVEAALLPACISALGDSPPGLLWLPSKPGSHLRARVHRARARDAPRQARSTSPACRVLPRTARVWVTVPDTPAQSPRDAVSGSRAGRRPSPGPARRTASRMTSSISLVRVIDLPLWSTLTLESERTLTEHQR
jgi:hypothetical protein